MNWKRQTPQKLLQVAGEVEDSSVAANLSFGALFCGCKKRAIILTGVLNISQSEVWKLKILRFHKQYANDNQGMSSKMVAFMEEYFWFVPTDPSVFQRSKYFAIVFTSVSTSELGKDSSDLD